MTHALPTPQRLRKKIGADERRLLERKCDKGSGGCARRSPAPWLSARRS